jgi:hypothetical protein
MKIIINESQLRLIVENEGEDNLINFTPFYKGGFPLGEWDDMFLLLKEKKERKGDKKYIGYYITGSINLYKSNVIKLDYLVRVDGDLYLRRTPIKLLPMLKYVGSSLNLYYSQIESLPNGLYVGGYLDIGDTPLSKKTTEEELRDKIKIKGNVYL